MAKTNLLAQNDDLALEQIKASVGRSVMNLSHSITMPVDVNGAIEIICCIECVPSDAFEITVECLLRQLSPLKVPIMTNFRLNTAFYYCDNRLGWKKWDRFMTGGRSGNEVYEIPRIYNTIVKDPNDQTKIKTTVADRYPSDALSKINYNNSIHTQLGILMNRDFSNGFPTFENFVDDTNELPIAFPFFDYQMICRDYYTNIDRLPSSPKPLTFTDYEDIDSDWAYSNLFPSDEDEIKLIDGIQNKSGYNTDDDLEHAEDIKGFMLDKKRYHNVRDDYFTSSKKAPMRGDPPTLNVKQNVVLPSGTEIDITLEHYNVSGELKQNWANNRQPLPDIFPQTMVKSVDQSNNVIPYAPPPSNDGNWSGDPYVVGTISQTNKITLTDDVELSQPVTTDVTASELLLLSQLSQWQILNMLHEPYYNDFLNAHFEGVHVGDSPAEKPIYIGGTSQLISINEILQTSQTSDTSPLGNTGATAMSLANNYVGKYYCNNYGYIIGVAYILPDLVYEPAMPRMFSRRTKEDFYSPEFANLSMQATLNKEIFYSNNEEWNNTPWGYTGSFDELRVQPNRIAGDLLNNDYTDLKAWVLRRHFDNDHKPSMSSKFLSIKDNVDKTAFQVPTMPAFMLQVANYIKAVRPMPKVAIPKTL